MFKVRVKANNKISRTVYAVTVFPNGDTMFLIYDDDWRWLCASCYDPISK
jgi:hypothetical protein